MINNKVAIVIPTHKQTIDLNESISLKQCQKVLGNYDTFLMYPSGIDITAYKILAPNLQFISIPPHWMSSHKNYSLLMTDLYFYNQFIDYQYVLTYQLDCFVFRDELIQWCDKGFDFIGAPWFENFGSTGSKNLWAVGNSGFCLRKVESFRKVLKEWHCINGFYMWIKILLQNIKALQLKNFLYNLKFKNFTSYRTVEDIFWGIHVSRFFPWFKVASIDESIKFSFEVNPSCLYELNNFKLPFGCHAWTLYEPDFWQKFIDQKNSN